MADIFKNVILKLADIGAFNFLFPFILTSAIFYGLLRKSKIFGESEKNVAVHAVIALSAAFMVWAFPILRGIDVQTQLSTFFMQGMVVMLVLMIGLMTIGMVAPEDLPKFLWEKIQNRPTTTLIFIAIGVGVIVFLTSGLISIFITPDMISTIPTEVLTMIGVFLIMIIPLIWIASSK
ncbi:MAG: hypothetical protein NZ893_00580 [Candidatus Aenigmarchaeota archaeon]|nr:hypothetical protein [Candidatus Aenigmarchaeota archaeon]